MQIQIKWATGKFHHRSCGVIDDSDFCIFIYDGISQGTQNELALAKKFKKPYTYYKLENGKLVEQTKQDELKEFMEKEFMEKEFNFDDFEEMDSLE